MANIVATLYVPSLRVMGCCSKLWLEVLHVSDPACIHKYRSIKIACVLETFITASLCLTAPCAAIFFTLYISMSDGAEIAQLK